MWHKENFQWGKLVNKREVRVRFGYNGKEGAKRVEIIWSRGKNVRG